MSINSCKEVQALKAKFDNDVFGITRVRVRYRVNFGSQKLRNSETATKQKPQR